jgi:hypothetical protein
LEASGGGVTWHLPCKKWQVSAPWPSRNLEMDGHMVVTSLTLWWCGWQSLQNQWVDPFPENGWRGRLRECAHILCTDDLLNRFVLLAHHWTGRLGKASNFRWWESMLDKGIWPRSWAPPSSIQWCNDKHKYIICLHT